MYLQEMFIVPVDCLEQGSTIPGKKKSHKINIKIGGVLDKMHGFDGLEERQCAVTLCAGGSGCS